MKLVHWRRPGPDDGGIATLPPPDEVHPQRSPLNPRTGEPRRPVTIWLSTTFGYAATTIVAIAITLVMWNSIESFAEASWMNNRMPTDPGSWVRVAFSIINVVVAAGVGGSTAFVAYYAFCGSGWTRWAGLVSAAICAATLTLTPLAMIAMIPAAVSAGLLWLPASRRYFNAWTALREWKITRVALPDTIHYGPVPRYR